MRAALATGLAVVIGVLSPAVAEACSCLCFEARLVPDPGATVPANVPALSYLAPRGSGTTVDESVVTLERVDGAAPVPHPFTIVLQGEGLYRIALDEPLVPFASYRLEAPSCSSSVTSEFVAGEAAPLPSELGALTASHGDGMVAIPSAACSHDVRGGWADVDVHLSESAAPWADVLLFQTFVDGRRWAPVANACSHLAPGESWRGRGRDRVYTLCEGAPGLGREEGEHSVEMAATLAGTDLHLSTDVRQIRLSCDEGCSVTAATSGPSWAVFLVCVALLANRRRARAVETARIVEAGAQPPGSSSCGSHRSSRKKADSSDRPDRPAFL